MFSARSRLFYYAARYCSTKTPAEQRMTQLLKEKISGTSQVEVHDVSRILKDEIKDMHGLSITTKVPK
ncbi:hypothetical protein OESDEN_08644 [Oesophagostomum dentatum]|uniref:Uncharacterized protein n=1 Tax=Oesophagostomum dentatum TaxID=61180 RepID=A0A0B1T2M0_OESDE|nr:hypothetical protein OESDEN_08644 [Oesophagostomum dentatum]